MVLDDGYAWNGGVYRSLSQVAKAITGKHARTEPIARYWHVTNPFAGFARNARWFAASRNEAVRFEPAQGHAWRGAPLSIGSAVPHRLQPEEAMPIPIRCSRPESVETRV